MTAVFSTHFEKRWDVPFKCATSQCLVLPSTLTLTRPNQQNALRDDCRNKHSEHERTRPPQFIRSAAIVEAVDLVQTQQERRDTDKQYDNDKYKHARLGSQRQLEH